MMMMSNRCPDLFELGKLYTLTGDNENAISAYEKVFENSPDFDLEITATIRYANALREAGQSEKALRFLKTFVVRINF